MMMFLCGVLMFSLVCVRVFSTIAWFPQTWRICRCECECECCRAWPTLTRWPLGLTPAPLVTLKRTKMWKIHDWKNTFELMISLSVLYSTRPVRRARWWVWLCLKWPCWPTVRPWLRPATTVKVSDTCSFITDRPSVGVTAVFFFTPHRGNVGERSGL